MAVLPTIWKWAQSTRLRCYRTNLPDHRILLVLPYTPGSSISTATPKHGQWYLTSIHRTSHDGTARYGERLVGLLEP